ncbi:hypothetical protein [Brevundimonas sp. Root1279]|uniref:hypothetical protein n=1 Tax=Brevundimonas sp. Root1279 TaxID=1736443 RepID=UPI0006F27600|nr:hypothetical protein [Brevundimonas sp. Root1279]
MLDPTLLDLGTREDFLLTVFEDFVFGSAEPALYEAGRRVDGRLRVGGHAIATTRADPGSEPQPACDVGSA